MEGKIESGEDNFSSRKEKGVSGRDERKEGNKERE